MPDIIFGRSAYRRENGRLPELKLVNMFVEATATAAQGIAILSRQRLVENATLGTGPGPVHGIFAKAGVFNGDVFTLSGISLFRNGRVVGTVEGDEMVPAAIAGGDPVSWAASATEVVVTRGAQAYSYNGVNVAPIAFPDEADVTAVTFLAGLFVFARAESHKFYWSSVLDARSIDALDFASAEFAPDALLDVITVGDSLILCGQETLETWVPNGNVFLPFNRIAQRLYKKGVIATGCAVEADNSMMFVGNDSNVYRLGDVPQRISDHGIEERISKSTSVSVFTYTFEGHTMTVVRLSQGSWVYDSASGQWCEFATRNRANWRARCATMQGDYPLFGDDEDGTVWQFGGWSQDGEEITREFTAVFPTTGPVVVNSLDVEAEVGWAAVETGQGAEPLIEMRSSRDAGVTFNNWRTEKLGAQGEYRSRVRYRRVGMFDPPGGLFEFRVSDPASCRVTRVAINEPGGGRGR